MATGTGKTGIIAALARCVPEIGTTLVLAPRIALRDQLLEDITSRFFTRLERAPEVLPKTVRDIDDVIRRGAPQLRDSVLVTTIQMLETLSRARARGSARERRKYQLYQLLKDRVDLILIDEGHYEPALAWSRAVRQIPAPRVLFTATPYRNDLKPFDIDYDFAAHFTINEATRKHVVRKVEIIQRTPTREPREFIRDVLSFYDQRIRTRWPDARVIIRCDNDASIRQMAQVLTDAGRPFVAIHETFADRGGEQWERRSVPRRDTAPEYYEAEGPVFWIHQFKLLEGIDDDRFRLIALFEPLGNARQVVQQIGRVIRNPEYPREGQAFLLDHATGSHERRWRDLVAYDDVLAKDTTDTPLLHEEFIDQILTALPDPTYFRGNARRRFSFEDFDATRDLALPRAANLLRKLTTFDLGRVRAAIERRLEEADCVFRNPYVSADGKTLVLVYVAVDSAPFLASTYFLSGTPGVIVVHEMRDLVAYYDSGGTSPFGLRGLVGTVGSARLRRLFSGNDGSKLVEAAMKNTQLGHRAARTRSLTAASIEETVPGLDDHAQVLTRVTGYSTETPRDGENRAGRLVNRRRYVGLRHGRVVEASERISLDEYCAWLREMETAITDANRGLPTFTRYASQALEVADPTPRNVLIDVFEVLEAFRTTGDTARGIAQGLPMEIEDLCQDVDSRTLPGGRRQHVFSVLANANPCEIHIEFDPNRGRYKLRSPDLDRTYYRSDGGTGGLVRYLNEKQSFRVVPVSREAVYVDGEFYEPVVRVGARFDANEYHVGKILEPITVLRTVRDEKGAACLADGSDWDPASLFGIVSRLGRGDATLRRAFGRPEILVCDDLGTEVADFILADDTRVVFIHAKAVGRGKQPKPYSASELSVVCAQAIKNVGYLSMFNNLLPKNLLRWAEPWRAERTTGQVRRRIRQMPWRRASPARLWDELRSQISNPRTHREVWLLLGGILSKSRLEQELGRTNATAEAIQAITLLHATLAAIGSIDAKLRIFCYP